MTSNLKADFEGLPGLVTHPRMKLLRLLCGLQLHPSQSQGFIVIAVTKSPTLVNYTQTAKK